MSAATGISEPAYCVRITAVGAECELTYRVYGFGAAMDRARALLAQYCESDPDATVSIIDASSTITSVDCQIWRAYEALL